MSSPTRLLRLLAAGVFLASCVAADVIELPRSALTEQGLDLRILGAKCDGVADDTDAFKSAYLTLTGTLCDGPGGKVLIPEGTCTLSEPLSQMCTNTPTVEWVGQGSGRAGIDEATTTIRYTGAGTAWTTRHGRFRDLRMESDTNDPATASSSVGLDMDRNNTDGAIRNVVVSGFPTGLRLTGTSLFAIEASGIRAWGNDIGVYVEGNNITLTGTCSLSNNRIGAKVTSSTGVNITTCSIEGNTEHGILFTGGNSISVNVLGNYFEGNGIDIEGDTTGGVDNLLFAGNTQNGSGSSTWAIVCEWCRSSQFTMNKSIGHSYTATFTGGYNTGNVWGPGQNSQDNTAEFDVKGYSFVLELTKDGIVPPTIACASLDTTKSQGNWVYCSGCIPNTFPCQCGSGNANAYLRPGGYKCMAE